MSPFLWFGDNTAFPSRPFLRRQESHSVVYAQSPKSPAIVRTQVDHSCESRNLLAMGGNAALITPPLAAHGCEIPAYAGMVFGGNGSVWAYLAIV